MRAHFARQPTSALILLVLGGGVAAFGGAALAARLGRRGPWPGWVAAGVLLLASVANFILVPYHPAWVVAAGLALVIAGGWLGARCFALPPNSA